MERYCRGQSRVAETLMEFGLLADAGRLLFLLERCAGASDCDHWRSCSEHRTRVAGRLGARADDAPPR